MTALAGALELYRGGKLAEAAAECADILRREPNNTQSLQLLATILLAQGKGDEAVTLARRAADHAPRSAPAQNGLGAILARLGRHEEALPWFDRALAIDAAHAPSLLNRADALNDLRRFDAALVAYDRVLALKPNLAEAWNNKGRALQRQRRNAEAEEAFRAALRLKPGDPTILGNLAVVLREQGKAEEALTHQRGALGFMLGAAKATARVGAICETLTALMDLPAIYSSEDQLADARAGFEQNTVRLAALSAEPAGAITSAEQALIVQCLFRDGIFHLAYQQRNDREVLSAYSAAATELLRPVLGDLLAPVAARAGGGKIRLGVASELLRDHHAANWAYQWLAHLPRADYEFFAYSLNGRADALTRKFAQLGAYRQLDFRPGDFVQALRAIRDDRLDILLIPDVGMTPSSRILSLARLAPVQCVGWGHPSTTGSPAIDYYLSGDLMEPPDAEDHYSEKLLRLPNLGLYFPASAEVRPAARGEFGLPEDKTIFGSVQSPLKYLPRHDALYVELAKEMPDAFFAFVGHRHPHITGLLETRLRGAFAKAGIDFDRRARFLPYMPHGKFLQLFGAIDVNLDTPGWNGGNTSVHCLAAGCPLVTLPGALMRGRHGVGLLRVIGMERLAAPTSGAYVTAAAELGRDREYRRGIGRSISQAKPALFADPACIRALDTFFKRANTGRSALN